MNKENKNSALEKVSLVLIVVVTALILFNQYQIYSITKSGAGSVLTLGFSSGKIPLLSAKDGTIAGPRLNADGRTTSVVEWPTISETPSAKSTGDPVQDALNQLPKGVPFYVTSGPGSELLQGISFDDPITSQKLWARFVGSRRFGTQDEIKLSPELQQRYAKIESVFTCDYCCGSPQSVTRISNCGCAHAYAWKGIAKFFLMYYGDKYTDEQIMGEMTKWKAIWYPKGMVNDYLKFQRGEGGDASSIADLDQVQGMVGGC